MENRLYIGIDPGAKGAIAAINDDLKIIAIEDYPQTQSVITVSRIVSDITSQAVISFAALEQVSSRTAQGVTSTFSFGVNYGIWQGVLAAHEIPYSLVSPKKWQLKVGLSLRKFTKPTDRKNAKVEVALRLFPAAENTLIGPRGPRGGPKDGRADALLIAYWCFYQYGGRRVDE